MIAIIDYKMGNLASVAKGFELAGAAVSVTASPKKLGKAKGIVLPGVGAFAAGMGHLRQAGLDREIRQLVKEGKPLLGICLGMQLLFTESEEHGRHKGLDLISGKVVRFRHGLKIPLMGWGQLVNSSRLTVDREEKKQKIDSSRLTVDREEKEQRICSRLTVDRKNKLVNSSQLTVDGKNKSKILKGIPDRSYFYFVHSYYAKPEDRKAVVGLCEYGQKFCAVVEKDNVFGCQFHPEKSAELGIRILTNFCKIVGEVSGEVLITNNQAPISK